MSEASFLVRNSAVVGLQVVMVAVAGVILPPVVLGALGRAHYGSYVYISSLFSFVAMLHAGVPQALNRQLAHALHSGSPDAVGRVTSTGFALLTLSAILAGIILFGFLSSEMGLRLASAGLEHDQALLAIGLVGGTTVVTMPLYIGHAVFIGHERYVPHSAINVGFACLRILAILYALRIAHGGFISYVLAQTLTNVLHVGLVFVLALRCFPRVFVRLAAISRTTASNILKFGLTVLTNTLATLLYSQAVFVLMGMFVLPGEITRLSLSLGLVQITSGFWSSLVQVIMPAVARLSALDESAKIQLVFQWTARCGLFVGASILGFVGAFSNEIMTTWLGREYDDLSTIVKVLCIGEMLTCAYLCALQVGYGTNQVGKATLLNLTIGAALVFVAALCLRYTRHPVFAISIAYAVAAWLRNVVTIWFVARALRVKTVWGRGWRSVMPIALSIGLWLVFEFSKDPAVAIGVLKLAFCLALFFFSYSICIYFCYLDAEERLVLREFVHEIVRVSVRKLQQRYCRRR